MHSAFGGRVDAESCLTLVFRDELMKLENMNRTSAIDRADVYCKRIFKNGSLIMYAPIMFNLSKLEGLDYTQIRLLSNGSKRWNSFLCFHLAYNDCMERTYQNCVHDEESNSCLWQYTYREVQSAEPPYGAPCPSYDNLMARKPCSCQQCDKTEWSPWKEYVDAKGKRFKIHYRPMDHKPCHNCYADTSACCSEYEIVGKNHTEPIQCFDGARDLNSTNATCICSAGATGLFCEIRKEARGTQQDHDFTSIGNLLIKSFTIFVLIIIGLTVLCLPCTQFACKKNPAVPRRKRKAMGKKIIHCEETRTVYSPAGQNRMTCTVEKRSYEEVVPYPAERQCSTNHIDESSRTIKSENTATEGITTKEQQMTRKAHEECNSVSIPVTRAKSNQQANQRKEKLLEQHKQRTHGRIRRDRKLREELRSQRRFRHYSM
uniref:EGF-like domain-containing protein n=1 Tax=Trichuris muris TaxID=70415 RepID=A0A5S6R2E3_TRIMR